MSKKQTVLVMGAGMSTRPGVHYLSSKGFRVIVGARTLDKVQKLVAGAANAEARELDIEREADLPAIVQAVKESDAVISMMPPPLHPKLAAIALEHGKHFLTTSYVSDGMRALEAQAKQKGLILINECGVDPGTDHMSAMRVFDAIHERKGKIVSFLSYCGGLPAPDAKPNPLGYKFSWAPRGVLTASRNTALFLRDGKEVTIPGKDLFASFTLDKVAGAPQGEFECYPNRNSVGYLDLYPLKGECKTLIRGTYRNKGWCDSVKALADIGYLDVDVRPLDGKSYAQLTAALLGASASASATELRAAAKGKVVLPSDARKEHALDVMQWLGLFSASDAVPASKLKGDKSTPLDALCEAMFSRMQYEDGERDMLVMQHTIVAEYPAEGVRETITSRLLDYGIAHGDTSMARTVSLPVAIATRLVLEGRYKHLSGLQLPMSRQFYEPILAELASLNIHFVEKVEKTEKI
jgi:saccharopine dehydrogenase-like NADP-dependent oxidoreductase